MSENKITTTASILSLKRDRRVGQTETGWALYITPGRSLYVANNSPGEEEYILPLQDETLSMLNGIAENNDPDTSILDQLAQATAGSANDNGGMNAHDNKTVDSAEDNHADCQNALIILTTLTDKIWGTGPDAIGKVSRNGIPYILQDDFCIVFDAAPFRMAFDLLQQNTPATIQATVSANQYPIYLIKQADLTLHFHLVHRDLPDVCQQIVNNVIATPLMLKGQHNGKALKAEV